MPNLLQMHAKIIFPTEEEEDEKPSVTHTRTQNEKEN